MPRRDLAKITREPAGMRLERGAACSQVLPFTLLTPADQDGARGQPAKRALTDGRSTVKRGDLSDEELPSAESRVRANSLTSLDLFPSAGVSSSSSSSFLLFLLLTVHTQGE